MKLILLLGISINLLLSEIVLLKDLDREFDFKRGVKNSLKLEHFTIFWGDREFDDLESWRDSDANSYPDYIDWVALALENSFESMQEIGYSCDSLKNLDVIIGNSGLSYTIDDKYYGYAVLGYGILSSYIVLNSKMPELLGQNSQRKNLEVTIAHELTHIFQYCSLFKKNRGFKSLDRWLFESMAVYFEELIYPNHNYHMRYIKELYENLNLGIFSNDGYAKYRGVYFWQFLEDKFEDFSILDIWESYLDSGDSRGAIEEFLSEKNFSLAQALEQFYRSIFYPKDGYYSENFENYSNYIPEQIELNQSSVEFGGCLVSETPKRLILDRSSNWYQKGREFESKEIDISFRPTIYLGDSKQNFTITSRGFNLESGWNLLGSSSAIRNVVDLNASKVWLYRDRKWIESPEFIDSNEGFWVYINDKE